MKKLKVMLLIAAAAVMLAGCTNKATEKESDKVQDQEAPSSPAEEAGEEEEAPAPIEVEWVADAIKQFNEEKVRQTTQELNIEYTDGSKSSDVTTTTLDTEKMTIATVNSYGDGKSINEYFEKNSDGKYYLYYNIDEEMIRNEVDEEMLNRAIEMSATAISLENLQTEIVGETEFDGKKAVQILAKSNSGSTVYNDMKIEDSITQEQMDGNEELKKMVEESKKAMIEYNLYFDVETHKLLGMEIDNTISDFLNAYTVDEAPEVDVKSSKSTIKYVTGDACETIKIPTEFKEETPDMNISPEQ